MPLNYSVDMLDKGPWSFFTQKKNAIDLQRFIVPWCIALYGLDYPKQLTLETVKCMVIAISDEKGLLQGFPSAAVPAKKYAIIFADVARRVMDAACVYIQHTFLVNLLPDSLPAPADRTVAKHRDEIRNVLVHLFENPILDTEIHAREMLSSVLGNPDLGFAKPIFDLVDNPHLIPLVQAGVSPCVWEDKLLHDKGSRSVPTVTSAATKGQELLFDFLGNYTYEVYTQYVQMLVSVVLCTYFVCTMFVL